jgi:hypothetical protein
MPDWSRDTAQLRYYAHSGVLVASHLELPEWSSCEQFSASAVPDIVVRLKPDVPAASLDLTQPPLITASDYRLYVPEVGDFHVRDGSEICVRPLTSASPASLRPWFFGPVWAALCYQRRFFIVHASAVRIGTGAVLFCGPAGRGKSTLAVQLAQRGYALLSDDICRLEIPAQGPPLAYPAPPRVKLWNDALVELGLIESGMIESRMTTGELVPDHLRAGKFHLSLPGHSQADPVPVSAAYLLDWGSFGFRELHGTAAFQRFFSDATWRIQLLEAMGQIGTHARRCLDFLRLVPTTELTRPREFGNSARTLDFIDARSRVAL